MPLRPLKEETSMENAVTSCRNENARLDIHLSYGFIDH